MTGEAIERCLSKLNEWFVYVDRSGVSDGPSLDEADVAQARAELRALKDAALATQCGTAHLGREDQWHIFLYIREADDSLSWRLERCAWTGESRGTFGLRDVSNTVVGSGSCLNGLPVLTPEARTALGEP